MLEAWLNITKQEQGRISEKGLASIESADVKPVQGLLAAHELIPWKISSDTRADTKDWMPYRTCRGINGQTHYTNCYYVNINPGSVSYHGYMVVTCIDGIPVNVREFV